MTVSNCSQKKSQKVGLVVASLVLVLNSACQKNKLTDESSVFSTSVVDPVEASVESGVTLLSGIADDQTNANYARLGASSKAQIWQNLFLESATADNCSRAFQATCSNGLKEATYSGCNPTGTSVTVEGSVSLAYSHMSCTLASSGDSVTRTYQLQMTGPRGGIFTHSSQIQSDYRGSSFGGGGKLTQTNAGWDLDILGRHSRLLYHDREILNLSTRTLSTVKVTGSLSRSSRVMDGGQIEVTHNLAKFTSVMTPSNLRWSATCCHPISGSLTVNYTGSKSGSAVVTFQGCGSANVNQGGQVSSITLSYCE